MLQITGQVVNVFTLDAGKDKEGKENLPNAIKCS